MTLIQPEPHMVRLCGVMSRIDDDAVSKGLGRVTAVELSLYGWRLCFGPELAAPAPVVGRSATRIMDRPVYVIPGRTSRVVIHLHDPGQLRATVVLPDLAPPPHA